MMKQLYLTTSISLNLNLYIYSINLAAPVNREPIIPGANKEKGYWSNIENRRAFFFKFAAERSFDPLIAANWINVTKRQMLSKKVRIPILIIKGMPYNSINHREGRPSCIIFHEVLRKPSRPLFLSWSLPLRVCICIGLSLYSKLLPSRDQEATTLLEGSTELQDLLRCGCKGEGFQSYQPCCLAIRRP